VPVTFFISRAESVDERNPSPLAGKRIVITRAAEQSGELAALIAAAGGIPIFLPMVCFAPPLDPAPLDAALRSLADFDWLLLTSANAVRFFAQRLRALGLPILPPDSLRISVVGPATARAAEECGLFVHYISRIHTALALLEELRGVLPGRSVLLPISDQSDAALPEALRQAGARVTSAVAYRTLPPAALDLFLLERLARDPADIVTFASPSAFRNFAELMGPQRMPALADGAIFAAIGPATSAAIRDRGFTPAIEAGDSTAAGLVHAITEHFNQPISGAGEK
jgi:uroporphyrinogen-III synthase